MREIAGPEDGRSFCVYGCGPDTHDARMAAEKLARAGYGDVLEFRDGLPVGGEFVFDMDKIACTNLAGDPLHDVLVDHLRSHDFFDTGIHPEARFVIGSARRIGDATAGLPNLRIEGELTLKGTTLPLGFDAVAGFTGDGLPAAQAVLAIDRTMWNVIYGSARFFRNLGMHLVNDLVEIHLRIVAK